MTYRSTPASDSIPALLGREAVGLAAVRGADGDVGEGLVGLAVEPGVEETERLLALGEQSIVDESNDSGEVGAGGGSATNGPNGAGPDDHIVVTLGSDIGVGAAGLVVEAVVLAVKALHVLVDGLLLVVGGGEVVGEASAGSEALDSSLGVEVGGAADGGDPRAAGGEVREELGGVLAIVGLAGSVGADTSVTGGDEVGDTASTELSEARADTAGVGLRDSLLIVTVGRREDVGQVVLGEDVVEESEVRLVGVGGSAETGLEGRRATSVVGLHGGRVADTEDELGIEVTLNINAIFPDLGEVRTLVVGAVVDDLELEIVGGFSSLGAELLQELGGVIATAGLVEVVVDADAVLVGGLSLVVDGAVQGTEAVEGGEADIAEARVGDVALGAMLAVLELALVLPPGLSVSILLVQNCA